MELLPLIAGDGGAVAGVGVSLSARATVVVGGAATGVGDIVAPEGVVVDVVGVSEVATSCLRPQLKVITFEALCNALVAVGSDGDPA